MSVNWEDRELHKKKKQQQQREGGRDGETGEEKDHKKTFFNKSHGLSCVFGVTGGKCPMREPHCTVCVPRTLHRSAAVCALNCD